MKSLQIMGPGLVAIQDVAMPEVKDHQVLVEIQMVATCPRWDIHMLAGKDMFDYAKKPAYPLPPGFPGHEAAGVVRAVGQSVRELKIGDRVASLEHIPGNGAYAQYLAYPEDVLIKLPDSVSYRQAVSFELLKCVMIGMGQFSDLRGKSMVVAGLGPAGLLAMQLARIWGARHVVGIDVSDKRLAYARGLGIGEVTHAREMGDQRFDLGYDCVGASASVQNVLDHTEEHAVIFGVLHGDVTYSERLWRKGIKLESYSYRPFHKRDRALLLAVIAMGLNTEILSTHHFSFHQYQEAVEALKAQDAIKVRFYPQEDFAI